MLEKGEASFTLKVDSGLVVLSLIFLAVPMLLNSIFLPITDPSFRAHIQTCTTYIFALGVVIFTLVGVVTVLKRRF